MGLRQRRLLEADESGEASQQGVRDYEAWYAARESMLQRGIEPSRRIVTATELALAAGRGEIVIPEAAEITVEEVARDAARPRGPRFGILVHAILMTCDANTHADAIDKFAAMHARILGANDTEVAAAILTVARTLASPLVRRAARAEEVHREVPVLIRLDDDRIIEGVADFAFLDRDGWVVIDFKTDVDIGRRIGEYRAQLALYVRGIRAATSNPARGVILWV